MPMAQLWGHLNIVTIRGRRCYLENRHEIDKEGGRERSRQKARSAQGPELYATLGTVWISWISRWFYSKLVCRLVLIIEATFRVLIR